jgi:hypothetical protein
MKISVVSVLASILSSSVLVSPAAYAQTAQEAAQPLSEPRLQQMSPTGMTIRQVAIAVEEGSWMDADVSPDGRTVAFALLGDIYTMPISGGTPTRIAEGLA